MSKIIIRTAKEEDAERLLEIYAPYVTDTAITFEYEVPTIDEFQQRINNTLKKYPYLVAEDENGNVMGYAYASAFKGRAAYDWASRDLHLCETRRGREGTRPIASRCAPEGITADGHPQYVCLYICPTRYRSVSD